jgi:hypothetical protein
MPSKSASPHQLRPTLPQSLAIIPSAYGLLAWLVTLALIPMSTSPISSLSPIAQLIIVYTLFCFLVSTILHVRYAQKALLEFSDRGIDTTIFAVFLATAAIGALGLMIYMNDISSFAGGLGVLVYAIVSQDLLAIRAYSGELDSIGTQLSYFSWIAIFLGFMIFFRSKYHILVKIAILGFSTILVFGNLFFIDRTRPLWIILPIIFTLSFAKPFWRFAIGRVAGGVMIFGLGLFFLFMTLTGKYSSYGQLDSLFVYATGGYGYLDALLSSGDPQNVTFVRTFYWAAKVIELAGVNMDIPNQVLDFRYVPFPTNVGTFIEPIFSDGGLNFVFLFVPILVLGLDRLGLYMFHRSDYLSLLIWGNIVFTLLISFFVPKFNQLPIWLFLGVALAAGPFLTPKRSTAR